MGGFELARRHNVYSYNITTTVTITNDARVIR